MDENYAHGYVRDIAALLHALQDHADVDAHGLIIQLAKKYRRIIWKKISYSSGRWSRNTWRPIDEFLEAIVARSEVARLRLVQRGKL